MKQMTTSSCKDIVVQLHERIITNRTQNVRHFNRILLKTLEIISNKVTRAYVTFGSNEMECCFTIVKISNIQLFSSNIFDQFDVFVHSYKQNQAKNIHLWHAQHQPQTYTCADRMAQRKNKYQKPFRTVQPHSTSKQTKSLKQPPAH